LADVSDAGAIPARVMRAVVFASVAIVLLLLLRAKSDGANPPLAVVLSSFALLAGLAWAFGSRERGAIAMLTGFIATQLALHIGYLFVTTGQLAHPGGAGLFCSPASVTAGACAPTNRGGMLLLVVQLTVALALALVMRGADAECWQLVRRPTVAVSKAVRRLLTAVAAIALTPPVERVISVVTEWVSRRPPRRLLLSHECGRRGPPARLVTSSLVAAPSFS
jgi:hypothetical protein